MTEADALALDHVYAHRGRIQQQVDDMVIQQVDLIDIKQTAIGRSQDPRLEAALALLDRLLDVESADDAVFRCAHGQIHEACPALRGRQDLAARLPRSPRIKTPPIWDEIAFKMSARFIRSWPTMAVKG
jgi:hypothetical protein